MSTDYDPIPIPAELSERVKEIELFKEKKSKKLEAAREEGAERLAGMTGQIMDTLEFALQSEDEGIRIKAALALFDRLVPRMRAQSESVEEVIEVVPESRKRLLEDIEEEMRKKLGG